MRRRELAPPAAAVGGEGFLGVDRSLCGKRWLLRPTDDRAAMALAQRLAIPEIVARVLTGRGVGLDQAETFLNPTLRRLLPDPDRLQGMASGAARLAQAVMNGERIAVFGDYDVDGATSTALLKRFFAALGIDVRIYVPDRIREGYGPNTAALLSLRAEGISLVVTVDCGINAHQPLAAAAAAGLEVIVVDHHAAEGELPDAVAVINPNRLDESGELGYLAAVGVAFLLVVAVNRTLRRAGWFACRGEPDPLNWLDLVALGTVCDMVPLDGVNRALVSQGLKVMAKRGNAGLSALTDIAGISESPQAYHLGFALGPRINAGGRVGEAQLGAVLLASDDAGEAARIAGRLDRFNRERQEIERQVLECALASVAARWDDHGPTALVVAAGENWHPGVIGIVASRLVERFNRPALVVAFDGDLGTGSGRSVRGLDLGAAVNAARRQGLLIRGGGHPMAAGFSVLRNNLDDLRRFVEGRLNGAIAAEATPCLYLDGTLAIAGATAALTDALASVGPFGMGNPEPRFAISGARLAYVAAAGEQHLRCVLTDQGGNRLDAIAFRCLETPLGKALQEHLGAPFHFVGRLKENVWNGRSKVQLLIDDAAPALVGS